MIRLKTLLIYNFGIALIFVLVGYVSIYARSVAQPAHFSDLPVFTEASRTLIAQDQELEHLRERAITYFDLARALKKARFEDTESVYYDVRLLSFYVAGLFAFGGLLLCVFSATSVPGKKTPAS
jgi:hypothetical protein